MAEIMDLDMGFGTQAPQVLEPPMVQDDQDVFEEILEDGAGVLADDLMKNLVLQPLGAQHEEPQMQDVVFEEEILACSKEDEDDLFDLF